MLRAAMCQDIVERLMYKYLQLCIVSTGWGLEYIEKSDGYNFRC